MAAYLLKSGIILTIFYLFYKLLLEKEPIHIFKRIYLLCGLLLAFTIPLITFTTVVEVESIEFIPYMVSEIPIDQQTTTELATINYWPIILWTVYGFGVVLFGLKFLINLLQIGLKVRRNTKQKVNQFTHVLLQNLTTPHTFFSYIFLNKHRYIQHQIPQEVFWHEETHAKQKHSLDVILIELLQVVFWFNPLLYFIKKDVKLNHEFLADRAVLNKGVPLTAYQEILLTFSTSPTEPALANALNYSSIKKRFTIMKTRTSKKAVWIKSLILLPLVAVLIYSFSEQKIVEVEKRKETAAQSINTNLTINNIEILINKNGNYLVNNIQTSIENLKKRFNEINPDITIRDKENITANIHTDINTKMASITDLKIILRDYGIKKVNINGAQNVIKQNRLYPKPTYKGKPTQDTYYAGARLLSYSKGIQYKDTIIGEGLLMEKLYEELSEKEKKMFPMLSYIPEPKRKKAPTQKDINEYKKSNLYAIWIDNKSVPNSELDKYQLSEIAYVSGPMTITKTGRSKKYPQPFWCTFYTHKYFDQKELGKQIMTYGGERIINYRSIEKINKKFNKLSSDGFQQKEANPQELEEYNKLAKKYNAQPEDKRVVQLKDLNRLESIFNKMTVQQKGNAEPFPNCPPPPIKNQDKATKEQVAEYNKLAKHYNSMSKNNMVVKVTDVNRLSYIYNLMTKKQKQNAEPFPNFPPPPPPVKIGEKVSEGYELPPPPPPAPSQKTIEKGSKKLQKAFKNFSKETELYAKAVRKYRTDKKGLDNIENQYKNVMELHKAYSTLAEKEGVLPTPPPPPPIPEDTTDHMIQMAKKGALFYYEGKKITSDKAIEITKKNKSINIQVLGHGSSKPIVKLSKKPITVEE
ncbi:M56 family metallopeptidase [Aureibaculum conchae]|uniref:M56 family metallopeptidase n=1 Tax=Aureibaculum sp. 2308TA14-22 TaxID=3108392 RepID=UPI003391B170